MRYSLFLLVSWLFLTPTVTNAADANGYTAKYEKPIGTPPPCSVTITSASDSNWSKLNDPSYRVICLAPGDYTSRGTVSLTASGTANNERWLRYYRQNDSDDNPWKQTASDRAKLRNLSIDGAGHWIVHRLTVDGDGAQLEGIQLVGGSGVHDLTINRVLVEDLNSSLVEMHNGNGPNIIVQNSVLRATTTRNDGGENMCIELASARGARIVNNELYDCDKSISSGDGNPSILDAKIENNDLYVSSAVYSDCAGNYTPGNSNSPCAANEAIISLKSGGSSGQPVEIIHNRIWGARSGDGALIGSGNVGEAPGISISANAIADANYVLIKNNVIWDMQAAISNWWGTPDHISIIGNIFYDIRKLNSSWDSYALRLNRIDNIEFYLNTIVGAKTTWLNMSSEVNLADLRCNVIVDSGPKTGGSAASTVQVDDNIFYNSPVYSVNGADRSRSFAAAADAKSSEYCFSRRLLTGPERVCIPNVVPSSASPHNGSCPSGTGTRPNIGVNDQPLS